MYFRLRIYGNFSKLPNFREYFLFLVSTELLYVNGVLHLKALKNRRFVELLTTAEFFHHTCLLKLSLKLLEGLLNVLALFYWYNNHLSFALKFYVKLNASGHRCHEKRVQSYNNFTNPPSIYHFFIK